MQKFLVIRFSSIGDIVLTSPVVRCLKKQVPNAEVHFLTKPAFNNVLKANPYIDYLHVLDKPLLEKIKELKAIGFDFIIDLHNNFRTQIIKSALGIPAFSFDKLNTEKAQLVNFKIDTLPNLHIVDRYINTLSTFGVKNDGLGLDYFIGDDEQLSTETTELIKQSYIAIAIGAQHYTKRLPTEKLIEICKSISNQVILLGGKDDENTGQQIAEKSGANVINLAGKLSLNQSAIIVKNAKQIITHDTGLMHIAAAFKKPIISVWGNTVPAFGMGPYYGNQNIPNYISEVLGLPCRPCSKIGFNECPKKHFNCMNLQDINAIVAATIA